MKWITLGLLSSAVIAFSATQKEPSNCSSRPCTYTITCASSTCTAAEVAEVQAALNDANRGDTIKLEAGRQFPSDRGLVITARPGSAGYLTITTTAGGKLPDGEVPPGMTATRITPAYDDVLPTIVARGPWALYIAGNNTPAEYIRLLGLRFTVGINVNGEGPLLIGNSGSTQDVPLTSPVQQPDNIIVEQCVFDQDYNFTVRRMISVNGRTVTIKNSYIDGLNERNADTQGINALHGSGPLTIENSFIGSATENVLFGGAATFFPEASRQQATLRYNYFTRMEERFKFTRWSGGMIVFKGKIIRASRATNNNTYVARNAGVTGNVEPAWPSNTGDTVDDNGITWAVIASNVKQHYWAKNNLEIKSAQNVQVRHNVFARQWVDNEAQQDNNVVFKLSNCIITTAPGGRLVPTSRCQCVPTFSGAVNVNGTAVTSADGKPLPNIHVPIAAYDVNPFFIKINGTDYPIVAFVDSQNIRLGADAGVQSNVPYTYGHLKQVAAGTETCQASWDKDVLFENNIIRGGAVGLSIVQWNNGVKDQIGNIKVRDNLMEDLDCVKWGNDSGGCGDTRDHVFLQILPPGIELNHNTIFGRNANGAAIHFEGRREFHTGDTKILNNIFPRAQRGDQAGVKGATYDEGSASLDNLACGGRPCPVEQFDRNIIAGVDLRKYVTGTNYNLCPGNTRCAIDWDADLPQYGKLFDDFNEGVYRVREGHVAKRGGTDGKDIGADYDQLPQIRKLRIDTTDRIALLKYNVSDPIKQIPCIIEVSDQRDLSTIITDLNANFFLRPGTDQQPDSISSGVRRTLRVGKNVALSPNTVYWYRLHCGGDAAEGSFTTKAPRAGSKQITYQVPASQMAGVATVAVEYGTSYDRATDTITGSTSTAPIPCTTGSSSCQVGLSIDSAAISYFRVVYRDQNGNMIDPQPVDAAAQPGVEVPATPKFTSSTSLNGASFIAGNVAPCQLVSFFGSALGPTAPSSLQLTPDGKAVTKVLADTRVLFDGEAAPLMFVSSSQINAIVPASVAQRRLTTVQIEYKEQLSDPVILPIGTARPGIFTIPASTQAVAQNFPDNSLNGATSPVTRGSVLTVFGTSGGATAPACEDASVIPLEARALQMGLSATVGGIPAGVIYGGSTPGFPGLMQFNIQIPADAPVGDAVPLMIGVGETQTQPNVTIAIR